MCSEGKLPSFRKFAHDNTAIIPTRCLLKVGAEKPKGGPPGEECSLGEPFHILLQWPPWEIQKPRYTSFCKIGTAHPWILTLLQPEFQPHHRLSSCHNLEEEKWRASKGSINDRLHTGGILPSCFLSSQRWGHPQIWVQPPYKICTSFGGTCWSCWREMTPYKEADSVRPNGIITSMAGILMKA